MSVRSELQAMTPGLRRYGRGLTGDAAAADDLVQQALRCALKSKGLGRGGAGKRRLYAIVTDFNRVRAAGLPDPDGQGPRRGEILPFRPNAGTRPSAPADPLAGLTLAAREAILLVAVEGFSYSDAADIAGLSLPALIARLAQARSDAPVSGRGAARGHLRLAK